MKEKSLTATQKYKLADLIIKFLIEHELWQDVNIYTNGDRFSSNPQSGYDKLTKYKMPVWRANSNDIEIPCEYGNKGTLTMTFEGPLYSVFNYHESMDYCDKITDEFSAILEKYGLWYEMGHAWSLSLYFN